MPKRATLVALSITLSLAACDADAGGGPPLSDGVYVVEGEADLMTSVPTRPTAYARLLVFVEDGAPRYVRDESHGEAVGTIHDLVFEDEADLSSPVRLPSATGTCQMQVRRDGCALFDFDRCVRLDPRTDASPTLSGEWMACTTDEPFVPRLEVVGAIAPDAITPDGAAVLSANYRLDPELDAVEVRVNGELREVSWTPDADPDTATLELGPVPPNAELMITHVGSRSAAFAHTEAFATTAVADLSFETLVEGSVDARGEPVTLVDGALEVRRMTNPPNPAFAYAVALGEPPVDATRLTVSLREGNSFGLTHCEQTLVRTDGTQSTSLSGVLDLPEGNGAAWLVVACAATYAPSGGLFGSTLRLEGVVWE
ncbi:MAG: hypothetical protein H6721_19500 [Sandaracinus sp.]|nr:hypothetical protein [Sandaracinus sp.]MCB9634315.1 hypothetical protein [Sandaracinus sp.]